MDMIRHDDERVKPVVTRATIVLQGLKEELGVGGNLEETATIVSRSSDEECARA